MNTSTSTALQDYYAGEREILVTEPALRETLRTLGVCHVYADYDGVGDSGQFEKISFADVSDSDVTVLVDTQTHDQVEALLYALLAVRHSGWENNDGAFGTFRWNLADGTLEHEHNTRYTDYETSIYDGFEAAAGESP